MSDYLDSLADTRARLWTLAPGGPPPRILLLYGSLRERSYSRFLTQAAAQTLTALGAEAVIFDPAGLPMPDAEPAHHPTVAELRRLSLWSQGQVWCSPERHGSITAVMKAHLDWMPLQVGGEFLTQGRTLAVMQINGGRHAFNGVNALRLLGRAARMIVTPNQLTVHEAARHFDEAGELILDEHRRRLADLMEELMKFTLLTRDHAAFLVDRHSEREAR